MSKGNYTKGDLFVATDDNTIVRIASGAATRPLFGGGAGQLPAYRAIETGDLPSLAGTYQPLSAVLTAIAGSGMSVFPRNVYVNVTPVLSTATTSEEDLMSFSLPAGTLSTNSDVVEVELWGAPSSNLIAKRVRLYFGSTVVYDTGLSTLTTGSFRIRARIYRTGAATQVSVGSFEGQTSALVQAPVQRASPTETLSGAVTIKVTSTVDVGAAAGDLRQSGMDVSVRRAA